MSSDNTQPLLPQQVPPRVKQRLTLKGRLTSRLPQIDIPPPLLVVAAVITTLFNCGAPMNKIAAGIFWVRGGFYPCSGDCLHQIVAVADAVQTYVSMDLIVPAVGGVVLDHLGAKATAIIALLPMTISYFGYLPQAAPMGLQLPMILQGSFLQMVLNPLITLGFQFESASKMVISLVSGGCELAGLVFPAFNYIMEAYNVEYTSCVVFLIAQSVAALLFVTFFLPNEFEDTSDVELPAAPPPSLSKQVRSKPYLLFMAAWIITIVNMTTILSAVDSILLANGDVDGEIATFFANGLAFSFVGCVFFGNVLTVVGTGPVFVALQLCALTTNICALIPNVSSWNPLHSDDRAACPLRLFYCLQGLTVYGAVQLRDRQLRSWQHGHAGQHMLGCFGRLYKGVGRGIIKPRGREGDHQRNSRLDFNHVRVRGGASPGSVACDSASQKMIFYFPKFV